MVLVLCQYSSGICLSQAFWWSSGPAEIHQNESMLGVLATVPLDAPEYLKLLMKAECSKNGNELFYLFIIHFTQEATPCQQHQGKACWSLV